MKGWVRVRLLLCAAGAGWRQWVHALVRGRQGATPGGGDSAVVGWRIHCLNRDIAGVIGWWGIILQWGGEGDCHVGPAAGHGNDSHS